MVRAILFDLGNVLVTFDERRDVVRGIVEAFSSNPLCAQSVVDELFLVGAGEQPYRALDTGEKDLKTLWREICGKARIHLNELPFARFAALYVAHLKPIEPMIALARRLQGRYHLVAVSNGDFGSRYVVDLLTARHGLSFLESFVSSEIGVIKPQLFARVKETLWLTCRIEPRECLYVDDIGRYVESAQIYNMHGILHDATRESPEMFVAKLRDFDIVLA